MTQAPGLAVTGATGHIGALVACGQDAMAALDGIETLLMVSAAVTGHEVSYVPETLEQAYASRGSFGAPPWQVEAWVSTYTAIAAGEMSTVTDDVERVTGRSPLGLAEVLRR